MSPRLGLILSIVVAAAALPATSLAQSTTSAVSPLAEGTRVRVSVVRRRDAITGVVVSHSADTLVVKSDTDSSAIAVPMAQVARLDVSRGMRTQKLKGAAIGLVGGAGVGALVGYATYEETANGYDFGQEFGAAVGATLGGLAGLIIGTLVGSGERERWVPMSALGRDARLGIAPARGGVALTASLTF